MTTAETINGSLAPRISRRLKHEWTEGDHGCAFTEVDGVRYTACLPANLSRFVFTAYRHGSPSGIGLPLGRRLATGPAVLALDLFIAAHGAEVAAMLDRKGSAS